jgi:phosphoribosylformylglycinamidine cyclo-ligase
LKLMRPSRELTYRIEKLPEVPRVLSFMVEQARMDAHAAYSTFNMGAGYALYGAAGSGQRIVALAQRLGLGAIAAGRVEEGPRRVILEPVGVNFAGEELELA